jgi:uncharacterized membrane protein YvlD (DUF360 family)
MHIEFTINLQIFYMLGFYYLLGMLAVCFLMLAAHLHDSVKHYTTMTLLWPIVIICMIGLLISDLYTGRFSRSKG